MADVDNFKETKEAMLALALLGKTVANLLKDGAQFDDALKLGEMLLLDGEFKTKVLAGVNGLDKVGNEVKNINLAGLLDLAKVLPELIAILES